MEALLAELRSAVGADAVLTDVDVTASYSRDMMPLAPSGQPLAVVFPTDTGAGGRRWSGPAPRPACRSCRAARAPG